MTSDVDAQTDTSPYSQLYKRYANYQQPTLDQSSSYTPFHLPFLAIMSDREKRGPGRPKRPRIDRPSSRDTATARTFAPVNNQSISSSSTQSYERRPIQSTETSGSSSSPQKAKGRTGFQLIGQQAPPGKVAILPLKSRNLAESLKGSKKGRIQHACDYCRKAKAGCSGDFPCSRCKNAGVDCIYGDGKRDKDRKQMTRLSNETVSLTQRQTDVTEALKKIRVDNSLSKEEIRAALDDVLAMVSVPTPRDTKSSPAASPSHGSESIEPPSQGIMMSGDEDVDTEVGSTGSLDVVNVDTDRDDTRATGHMGKSSAVAWAKRTADECENESNQDSIMGKQDTAFVRASYLTEDADVMHVDLSNIDAFEWPEPKLADDLVQSYFDTVHIAFPILDKANFMITYNSFSRGSRMMAPDRYIWLGTLNAMFAVTSFHANLTKNEHLRGHHNDHLIYCERAKLLCMQEGLLYQDANVSTTRALGMICLYYLATCRLNRAWTICGLAIRQALTLGLHIRSEAVDLSDVNKEQRVRVWWSLYSLECLLNELTGRPSCISDRDISTPLPMNIDVDDLHPGQSLYKYHSPTSSSPKSVRSRRGSKGRPAATYQMPVGSAQPLAYSFPVLELPITPSTYFIYRTQLSIIGHEIITQLYCAATIKEKWSEVQDTIRRIDRRLLAWRDSLPKEFDIEFDTWPEPDLNDPFTGPRTGLAMLFNSSRMILFRPCLCRFEGRIQNQSEKSKEFNQESVETCVHSARKMISLLRWSSRSAARLYAIAPWWNTIHYLCEALSVLMLEMAFRSQHLPKETAYILEDAKKGVNWLAMMSDQSVSARKAWEIFDHLIRVVAPMIRWSVFDMPTEAPVPPGYNWQRFRHAASTTSASQPVTTGPNLTESNLAQLNTFTPTDPSPTWHQHQHQHQYQPTPQHVPQTTDPQLSYLFNTPSYPTFPNDNIASNPLDQTTALQRFSAIGNVHGHYDDPWHNLFDFATASESMGLMAPQGGQGMQDLGMDDSRGFYGAGQGFGEGAAGSGEGPGFGFVGGSAEFGSG